MVKQNTYRLITAAILTLVVVLIGVVLFVNKGFGIDPSSSARTAVEGFGAQLQNVSLLDPAASSTMASVYGPLVTPELLAIWQSDPEEAPGRLTSSPYPDRIEIDTIVKQGIGYIVSGTVVYATSDGESSRSPVILQIVPIDGEWLIAAYEEQQPSNE
jgi:hypothetical protein